MSTFEVARQAYADLGVDANAAIDRAISVPISIHCWQADDVAGLEHQSGTLDSGGIMATGSYPGKARSGDELRQDYERVLSLCPGTHRVNLHASYGEPVTPTDRDQLTPEAFRGWIDWAQEVGVKLDFNPTYFGHPMAASGFTLSSADPDVRQFWIRHGIASRRIASEIGRAQLGECVNNHWIPDGAKDSPADRWSPRRRLLESLDEILRQPMQLCTDSVESKLFGLGSEDYVVGSYEFYSSYSLTRNVLLCLDMGHFHPTESIADKLSALLQFHGRLLTHVSRPMRWDSDHVVLFNDDLRSVFLELARGGALSRVLVALDFFDASINRIGAYVIGVRATRKALLYSLLEPSFELKRLEAEGKPTQKLAMMEEIKTLPFGSVWDELCRREDVPVGAGWIREMEEYERAVLAPRT